jgi:hypothetical protein
MSLTTVVQVEVRASDQQSQQLKARMNAMLALQEALGELQRTTGPDQRVTATGSLWENPAKGTEHLVGVWSAVDETGAADGGPDDRADGEFLRWLVSRKDLSDAEAIGLVNTAQPIAFVSDGADGRYTSPDSHVVLVGSGSTAPTNPADPNEEMRGVVAEKREVLGPNDQVVGKYAWWVGDEGAKAKINIIDPVTDPATDAADLDRFRLAAGMSMPRAAGEAIEGFDFLEASEPLFARMTDRNDLALLASNATELRASRERFHDFTFWSYGVQSNTMEGGLKQDLSLLFELSEDEWRESRFYGDPFFWPDEEDQSPTGYSNAPYINDKGESGDYVSLLFNPKVGETYSGVTLSFEGGDDKQVYGPTWDRLRNYYRSYKGVRDKMGQPVITARAATPSTSDVPQGSHKKRWENSISSQGFRIKTTEDPMLNKTINQAKANGGTNQVVRTTGAAISPYLVRTTIQVYLQITGANGAYTANYTLLPVVYLHNPYNVSIEVPESRFLWNLRGNLVAYSVDEGPVQKQKIDDASYLENFEILIWPVGQAAFVIPKTTFGPGEILGFSPEGSSWKQEVEMQSIALLNPTTDGLRLPPIEILNLDAEGNQVLDASGDPVIVTAASDLRALYSVEEQMRFAWEMLDESEGEYDTVYAGMTRQSDNLTGADWFEEGGLTGNLNKLDPFEISDFTTDRVPITTFDIYVKPADVTAYLPEGPVDLEPLAFPTFVGSNPLASSEAQDTIDGRGSLLLTPLRIAYAAGPSVDEGIISSGVFNGKGRWGPGNDFGEVTQATVLSVPTSPPVSIGQLQHANLSDFPQFPALAIGNSFTTPFLEGNDKILHVNVRGNGTETAFPDFSFFSNHALWDGFYFSGIAPESGSLTYDDEDPDVAGDASSLLTAFITGGDDLHNPRMELFSVEGEDNKDLQTKLESYETSASRLLLDGSFNVNSTSVEAWKGLLSGLREADLLRIDSTGSLVSESVGDFGAFPRQPIVGGGGVSGGSYLDPSLWSGYTQISDEELSALAEAIVEQIRERSREHQLSSGDRRPFCSLAAFVNRMPTSSVAAHTSLGLVQSAVNAAGINDKFSGALSSNPQLYNDEKLSFFPNVNYVRNFQNTDFNVNASSAAPGYLLQSDILQSLGPYLSVRSDTFRIRTYGEVTDPLTGEVEGKAWLEAIVQRSPLPVVPSTSNEAEPDDLDFLGRKYVIVKVNWLAEDQI